MGHAIAAQGLFELVAVVERRAALGMLDFVGERFERAKSPQVLPGTSVSGRSGADDFVDTEDFVSGLRLASGLQLYLGSLAGQVDGLGTVLEQVDRRGQNRLKSSEPTRRGSGS